MAGSLDTHVNNLSELYNCDCKDDDEKEQNIKIRFSKKSIHSRCKTCRKRFKQPIQLLKDKFSNTYSICDNDINKFIISDTLQLADVFEKFINLCLREYSLDPGYFYTTHGLALEACLKVTKVNTELLTGIDMLLMFKKGIRGGLSQAIHRYATANNKYMSNYNPQQLSTFLMYLDANNLYGWAMCKKLPIGGYMWAKNLDRYTPEFIKNYDDNSNVGYLFEVDIDYPKHLHELHSDLPFLPERDNKSLATL